MGWVKRPVPGGAPPVSAPDPPSEPGPPLDEAPLDEAPLDEAPLDEAPLDDAPPDDAPPDEAPPDDPDVPPDDPGVPPEDPAPALSVFPESVLALSDVHARRPRVQKTRGGSAWGSRMRSHEARGVPAAQRADPRRKRGSWHRHQGG
jgi:hypothetical protein